VDAEDAAIPLLVVGYPVAVAVIVRWVPVVREQRTRWFLVHGAGMVAIIVGWALRRPVAVPANALWLVASTVWYRWGGRRRGRRDPPRP
jgi:hypothetical protein